MASIGTKVKPAGRETDGLLTMNVLKFGELEHEDSTE